MKIIVLDGFTLNPGDLSWGGLEELGKVEYFDRSSGSDIITRAKDADAVLTNKVVLDKSVIEQLPRLKYIGVTATGTNIVDHGAARARGIVVTNVPAYGVVPIAQAVFASLLELTNHVGHYDRGVHSGQWSASPDFCYWDKKIVSLVGLTMGIVGLGAIGSEVAKLAQAFGMKLLVHTRTHRKDIEAEFCELDDLFARADVVSLHCALTPETKGLVNAHRLSLMKPAAYLLNFARGALVDEQALADALNKGRLAAAAVDVLSKEPPLESNPLLTAKNCIITPHIAWASFACRKKLLEITIGNLRAYLRGEVANVVAA